MKQHTYNVQMTWTGNNGEGTKTYAGYRRDHVYQCDGKPEIPGSSDPNFRGDRTRYNPEELLVAALSSCHMLWYLHLCSVNKIVVESYDDHAVGTMDEKPDGSGNFVRVALRPRITISSGDRKKALELHHDAHRLCFIANSVNFPVEAEPVVEVVSPVVG